MTRLTTLKLILIGLLIAFFAIGGDLWLRLTIHKSPALSIGLIYKNEVTFQIMANHSGNGTYFGIQILDFQLELPPRH
jgi:hypothetical protein